MRHVHADFLLYFGQVSYSLLSARYAASQHLVRTATSVAYSNKFSIAYVPKYTLI